MKRYLMSCQILGKAQGFFSEEATYKDRGVLRKNNEKEEINYALGRVGLLIGLSNINSFTLPILFLSVQIIF